MDHVKDCVDIKNAKQIVYTAKQTVQITTESDSHADFLDSKTINLGKLTTKLTIKQSDEQNLQPDRMPRYLYRQFRKQDWLSRHQDEQSGQPDRQSKELGGVFRHSNSLDTPSNGLDPQIGSLGT